MLTVFRVQYLRFFYAFAPNHCIVPSSNGRECPSSLIFAPSTTRPLARPQNRPLPSCISTWTLSSSPSSYWSEQIYGDCPLWSEAHVTSAASFHQPVTKHAASAFTPQCRYVLQQSFALKLFFSTVITISTESGVTASLKF